MRRFATFAALLAGISLPAAALAQTAADTPPQDGASGAADTEILVTAQRREQRLSDVPISITAISGEALTKGGVLQSTDLGTVVPGMQVQIAGAFAQPTVRGIGTTVTSAASDPNVALYIDGVYMPSQAGNAFNFADVQRIEVLKGPQGTLYGRNATGGAINITTLRPSGTPKLKLSAGFGSFDEVRLNGYASAPLGSRAAFSIAGLFVNDDGYARDVLRGVRLATTRDAALRGKLLLEPMDALEVTLAGDWSKRTDITIYSLKTINDNTASAAAIIPPGRDERALSFTPDATVENYGGSVRATLDLGGVTLGSISSLRKVLLHALTDSDRTQVNGGSAEFNTSQKTFTQELTLTSGSGGPFSWVAGVYYYNDLAKHYNFRVNGNPSVTAQIRSEAISGFAEGTYEISDALSVIGGVRYNSEKRELDSSRPTGTPRTLEAGERWNSFTPRASLRYRLTDDTNVYATYSKGFKSGTYNISAFSNVPVDPEKVDAYEVGAKFYRSGFSVNGSAFYYVYDDIQIQAVNLATGLTNLSNAAEAEIYGFDMDFKLPVSPNFDLAGGLAYTHGEYSRFPGALVTIPRTSPAVCGANPHRPCGNVQTTADVSGNAMVRSPRFTATLTPTVRGDIGLGEIEATATFSYNSGYYWDVGNRLKEPSFLLINGQVALTPKDSPLRISLWGRNLTNKLYSAYTVDTTAGDASAFARPRTFGFTLALDIE